VKEVLTTFEAARMLNLSPYTIRLWIIKGLLNGYKTAGGHRRIKTKDLMQFLKKNGMPIPSFEEKRKKVAVLASDNAYEMQRIKRFKMPFTFLSVKNPIQLGVTIEKAKPQVVLLDFDSKVFSFKDLGEAVKENSSNLTILIGFAKRVTQNVVLQAEKSGFFDVLTKPLSEDELKKTFSKLFEKRKNPYRLKSSR